jgi:hypothetical protein
MSFGKESRAPTLRRLPEPTIFLIDKSRPSPGGRKATFSDRIHIRREDEHRGQVFSRAKPAEPAKNPVILCVLGVLCARKSFWGVSRAHKRWSRQKVPHTVSPAHAGAYTFLKSMDPGLRREDAKRHSSAFYESINQ